MPNQYTTCRIAMTVVITAVVVGEMSSCIALAGGDQDETIPVVFMEPLDPNSIEPGESKFDHYHWITDNERIREYTGWLENGAARMAFDLVEDAWQVMADRGAVDDEDHRYHIALVPQGNYASSGFVLHTPDGIEHHESRAYIKLDPSPRSFGDTLLHETGHVVLSILSNGTGIPAEPISSIPHTTAALTDRGTAFNEGFAIHLETLAGHFLDDPDIRKAYRFNGFDFDFGSWRGDEFYRHAIDLRNYAQTRSRYEQVRRNNFAFATAFRNPDYLRVQLDPARDFAKLRDANQLLQSEGFYATFFFAVMTHGLDESASSVDRQRQSEVLNVIASIFAQGDVDTATPYMLRFVEEFMNAFPERAATVADILTDLSHGVFSDSEAAVLWEQTYRAALELDIANFPSKKLDDLRFEWSEQIVADPQVLYSRLGPQIPCIVPDRKVLLVAFGQEIPVAFDINTVQEGILRIVPEISEQDVQRWLAERAEQPFRDADDFKLRVGADSMFLQHMEF